MQYKIFKYFGEDLNKPELICNLINDENYIEITDLVLIFYCYEIGLKNLDEAKFTANEYLKNNTNLNEAEQQIFNKYLL